MSDGSIIGSIQTVITVMFAFSFEQIVEQSPPTLDETSLLSSLFLTILENQRLQLQLSQQAEEVSFSAAKRTDFNREQEYQLEIELKQVKIDNLNAMLRELQAQLSHGEKQLQESMHRCAVLEINFKQEMGELKTQMHYYKAKYEEEAASTKKAVKMEAQFKAVRAELEAKNKQMWSKVADLQTQLAKNDKNSEQSAVQHEKRSRELRNQVELLRNELSTKEQQCFSLRASLNDCPKMEELNRWIGKVKEYEQRQMQACAKMSQLSQQLCASREKGRRLQSEFRELQKVKMQLESALTESRGNEDSMVIYFDRLETYEKVIKELQEEIRRMEGDHKNHLKAQQIKVESAQKEKEAVVAQWKAIAEEMEKQKTILSAMQKQIETYQKFINEQNERQAQNARIEQISQIRAIEEQRARMVEQDRRRQQEIQTQPYSFIENSKCSERTNRSLSLQNKKNNPRTQTENDCSILQSHLVCDQPSKQVRPNSTMGRAASEQRIVYHSDPHSRNSTSRLNTQTSHISRETGCGQCLSRVQEGVKQDYSNRSLQLNERYRQEESRNEVAQITDEKKLLMEKLNILKPQDPNLSLRADRNISSLYTKNYRQANPTSQNLLKIAPKQSAYQATAHRLQLGRREDKENINDMIVKRYANMMQRS